MKTIEEKASEYAEELLDDRHYYDGYGIQKKKELEVFYSYEIETAFEEGAKYALEHQWISVKDRLPKNDDIVMVTTINNCFMTAYYHGTDSGFIIYGDDAYNEIGEITHWMPIPKLNTDDSKAL